MVIWVIGKVNEIDDFYIDYKIVFKGIISFNVEFKNLKFDGFVKLDVDKLNKFYWFMISNEGDKNDLVISFDIFKSFEGDFLWMGFFLSKEMICIYLCVMVFFLYWKDCVIFFVIGILKYNKDKD